MEIIKKIVKNILQYQAVHILKKYKPKIIAVVGGVGKTTARESIYAVLSKTAYVRKSEKSFTAEIGVPLTIIGCRYKNTTVYDWMVHMCYALWVMLWRTTYPSWLILEIDADKPGDLQRVAHFIKPDILVLTAMGRVPAHIELFGTLDSFIAEHAHIIQAVSRDGVIVYTSDDETVAQMLKGTPVDTLSCAAGTPADIKGDDISVIYGNDKKSPVGMSFTITSGGHTESVTVYDALGSGYVYASLYAYAVGTRLAVPFSTIGKSLNQIKAISGRMRILSGIKDTLIIDDTYNSSPIAVSDALQTVRTIVSYTGKTRRCIVVIGDMLELGKYSADEHRTVAHDVQTIADYVFCVGIRARMIAYELYLGGYVEDKIFQYDTAEEAGRELQNFLEEADIVLVKGSQMMRMERVVEEVMRYPQDKQKTLVRQEPEWLIR
jgi:UDP-N-acetylmuramoyl-tripeptide--D-alanyl-D-alanine ligase